MAGEIEQRESKVREWTKRYAAMEVVGTACAMAGALLGIAGGIGYARAMLYGLSTIWRTAVGTSALQYHAHPGTLLTGAFGSVVVAALTIALALRKQARQPARELLAEGGQKAIHKLHSRNGVTGGTPSAP